MDILLTLPVSIPNQSHNIDRVGLLRRRISVTANCPFTVKLVYKTKLQWTCTIKYQFIIYKIIYIYNHFLFSIPFISIQHISCILYQMVKRKKLHTQHHYTCMKETKIILFKYWCISWGQWDVRYSQWRKFYLIFCIVETDYE